MRASLLLLLAGLFISCDSGEDRVSGVCYCEFVRGDDQQYDLTDMTRSEQVAECQRLDGNAGNFGGRCELE